MRALVLFALVVGAMVAMLWSRPAPDAPPDMPTLAYVATAHQLGVVGYRDPAGALSPDGRRIAYTEGRVIKVVPVGGGPPITLPPGEGQIRAVAWAGNDRIVAQDAGTWWAYQAPPAAPDRQPLWPSGSEVSGTSPGGEARAVPAGQLRQLTFSLDGKKAAALVLANDGPELWTIDVATGRASWRRVDGRPSAPAFTPSGEVACVNDTSGRPRLSLPCGDSTVRLAPDVDVVGPIAYSPDGSWVYFASPDKGETVDLWRADTGSGKAHRLTDFARDAYAPSMATDGAVLFKVQSYRTFVADAPAAGGPTRQLATFQSETPSWHPRRPLLAFTFGTWRRVMDDARYPDIAQEIGTLDLSEPLPATRPAAVIAQSVSEDQAMAWSPNGRWIAFHSHRDMSDDLWLRPAEGRAPDRRITFLGRGAEVGWPRWSPDGQMVLLDGARKRDGRSVVYVIGVDQQTGEVTADLREVTAEGYDAELTHAEWLPSGSTVVALAREAPGRQAIVTIPVTGGRPYIVHRWASEHDFSGLGASPDGKQVAFTAPAPDGFFQIFRLPIAGGDPVQVTTDPSNKSQPSWSPDGRRIAFTVWSYDALFWLAR